MFSLNDLYELIAKISNLKGILALILGFALLSILLWWRAKKLNLGPQNQILDSRWSYTSHEVQEFFKNLEPKGVELYKWTEITVDGIFPFIYGAFCATFIVLLYPTEVARILILFPAFTTLTDLGENLTIFALASQYSKSKNSHLSIEEKRGIISWYRNYFTEKQPLIEEALNAERLEQEYHAKLEMQKSQIAGNQSKQVEKN